MQIPPEIEEKLRRRNFWTFATVNEDGSPTATPLWVDLDDPHILVNTGLGRRKERNVRRERRVALTLIERDDPYSWVEIRGRVVAIIRGPEADASFAALANKYLGDAAGSGPATDEPRVLLKIQATQVNFRTEPGSRPADLDLSP